ncbi:MAG TPA: FAD-dependent oxidoreductase, partial [bacterium]|nr:FAD-dependent oxidoreductase [bacterium]
MNPILIIGAGPCGLGAARALQAMGRDDWEVCEANEYAGGLSASFLDPHGFTWDVGGHVLFTKYPQFAALVRDVLAGEYHEHQRSAWVRLCEPPAWVPYPYQDNLHCLPAAMRAAALRGLERREAGNPRNFEEWIRAHFGEDIARQFMLPYNAKVWGTSPREMDFHWIADRVKTIDAEELKRVQPGDPPRGGWGPNATFLFPQSGGTGEIFRRLAAPLQTHIRYGAKLVALDARRKVATFSDGREVAYRALISTLRLDELLAMVPGIGVTAPLRAVGG